MTPEQQHSLAARVNEMVQRELGALKIAVIEWQERATRAEAEVAELRANPATPAKPKK